MGHKFVNLRHLIIYLPNIPSSCLGSVSKDFTNNEINEISMKGTACDHVLPGIEKIFNIHEYVLKKIK